MAWCGGTFINIKVTVLLEYVLRGVQAVAVPRALNTQHEASGGEGEKSTDRNAVSHGLFPGPATSGAGLAAALPCLVLVLQSSEALGTVTLVALAQVNASSVVVAWSEGTFINIKVTVLPSESSGTVAFGPAIITVNVLTIVIAPGSCGYGLLSTLALDALRLAGQGQEVVERARGAGGQAGSPVVARRELLLALP